MATMSRERGNRLVPRNAPGTMRIYTAAETQQHTELAANLLAQPLGSAEAVSRTLQRPVDKGGAGIGKQHAQRVVRRVLDRWAQERQGSTAVEDARSAGIARVRHMLSIARGRRAPAKPDGSPGDWIERPDHKACAAYEQILMRLQGTDAPVRVDLTVRVGAQLDGVIGNLTAAQVERFVAQRRELERLADLARRRLPEAIDVKAKEGDTRVSPGVEEDGDG
jgi:hypothetical protein